MPLWLLGRLNTNMLLLLLLLLCELKKVGGVQGLGRRQLLLWLLGLPLWLLGLGESATWLLLLLLLLRRLLLLLDAELLLKRVGTCSQQWVDHRVLRSDLLLLLLLLEHAVELVLDGVLVSGVLWLLGLLLWLSELLGRLQVVLVKLG